MIIILLFSISLIAAQDVLRTQMLRPSFSDDADVGLGRAMSTVFIDLISQLPRISVVSFRTFSFTYNADAPKEINFGSINWQGIMEFIFQQQYLEIDFGDYQGATMEISNAVFLNDDIPNFLQGMAMTCLAGLIPLLLSVLLLTVLCCGCCHCLCRCCICPKKLKAKDWTQYNKKYKKKKRCTCICRLAILVFSIATVCGMLVWGIFSYQSHIGVSKSFDVLEQKYEVVVNFVAEIFKLPASAVEIIDTIGELYNNTVDEVMKILPVGDALLPHIKCIEDIIASLPDLGAIREFMVEVNASFTNLPSFQIVDDLAANISKWIDKMKYEDLAMLEDQLQGTITSLDNVQIGLGDLKPRIQSIDVMKAAFPSSEELTALEKEVDKISVVQNDLLTDAYFDEFNTQLDNLDAHPGQEVGANVRKFQQALNVLDSIDFQGMNDTIASLDYAKSQAPDTSAIMGSIDALTTEIDSIDLTGINPSLVALNESIYGLINVIDGIDEVLVYLETTILGMIPDFSPLFDELGKIEITIETASCISNITAMIVEFNRTVIILPAEISGMINQISDMQGFLRTEVNFDDVLGTVDDMLDVVEGQLQSAIADVANMSMDGILDELPDIGEMGGDIDTAVEDFGTGQNSFNVSDMAQIMLDMNDTVAGVPEVDSYYGIISDVENATAPAIAQNDTIDDAAVGLEEFGTNPCDPCPSEITGAAVLIKSLLTTVKSSSDSVPTDDMFDMIGSFNSTLSDLPDSSEYTSKIDELNVTLSNLPDMCGILTQIELANVTLSTSLPFDAFVGMIDTFGSSTSSFDLSAIDGSLAQVEPLYAQINQSNIFSQFDILNEQVDPIINQVPALLSTVVSQINALNETVAEFGGYITTFKKYKDIAMKDYVYKYDGYRLLAMALLIILVIPIPGLTCCGCLCFRNKWFLIILGFALVFIAIFCWLLPAIGIPLNIALNEGCDRVDHYVGTTFDTIANAVEFLNFSMISPDLAQQLDMLGVNVTDIIRSGLRPEAVNAIVNSQMEGLGELMPNMTLELEINFNFEPILIKDIFLNYVDTNNACGGEDVLQTINNLFNSSVIAIFDGVEDMLAGFEIMEGFIIHPQFPRTLRGIFMPMVQNFSQFLNYAEPIIGCTNLNAVYKVGYDLICEQFRYSFIFMWGTTGILGFILCLAGIMSCCCYTCLDCCHYDKVHKAKASQQKRGVGKVATTTTTTQQQQPVFQPPRMMMVPQGAVQVLPVTNQNFVVRTHLS